MSRFRRKALLLFGGRKLQWLFNADFSKMADQGPPLPDPFPAQVGSLVAAADVSDCYISGGRLILPDDGLSSWRGFKCDTDLTGMSHVALFTLWDGSGQINAGSPHFNISTILGAGQVDAFGVNSSILGWYDSNGNSYLSPKQLTIAVGPPLTTGERLLSILTNRHGFLVRGGELYYVHTLDQDAADYTELHASIGNYGLQARVGKLGALSLPANGYDEWERDFSEVTDSLSAPASGTSFNCEADAEIRVSATYEAGTVISTRYRRDDATGYQMYVEWAATGALALMRYDSTGYHAVASVASVFSDGISYDMTIIVEGDRHRVYLDGVLQIDAVDGFQQTMALGRIDHTLATNDITITTHPYPALGPATSRSICPQIGEEQTMDPDSFIIWENVKLPPAGEYRGFSVRYVDATHRVELRVYDTGKVQVSVYDGTTTTPLEAAAGSHSDGDDILLRLSGSEARLWVGGTLYTSTAITHLTGTIARTESPYGGRFPCDACNIWPVDLVGKNLIPKELS